METKQIDRATLLNIVLIMEGVLLLAATGWSYFAGVELLPHLHVRGKAILLGCAAGLALSLSSSILYWLSDRAQWSWLKPISDLVREELAPIFAKVTILDVVVIALVSGFCEEIAFRGVLQGQFGLVIASMLFGILHCPSLRYPHYGLWACTAGFYLGFIYYWSHNLWVPIIAHVVNNIIGLAMLRHIGRTTPAANE
jgi:hypothetical protein